MVAVVVIVIIINASARAYVRSLMTRKSCKVGMRNAILRNYLNTTVLDVRHRNGCKKLR